MSLQGFIDTRRGLWDRFEGLARALETSRPGELGASDLEEFVHLYRIVCSDLARARSEELGEDVESYLNQLVARGYARFHRPQWPRLQALRDFFFQGFPRAVREQIFYVAAAALLFLLPIAGASALTAIKPELAYLIAPPEVLEGLAQAYGEGHQQGRSEGTDSLMTGYYVNNNIGIAFRCFATGIFFGLGSIFFLLVNGASIGAIAAYICVLGYGESFLSFVAGHSAFELVAIVLSGAMGLRMGAILVNPGPWRRLDALILHSSAMIQVVLGSAAMLLVAALIEGFWSPSSVSALIKFGTGGLLWLLVICYFALAGRRAPRNKLGEAVDR